MLRITLREILLGTFAVALSLGWLIDHQVLAKRVAELEWKARICEALDPRFLERFSIR